MRTVPGSAATRSVRNAVRGKLPEPTLRGMPALQASSADRNELGKITARSAFRERTFRATDRHPSPGAKVVT
jgi:hypothetical protein